MELQELLDLHKEICEEALAIIEAKNHDYASNKDIFKNLRRHGRYGICVRLQDKLCRMEALIEKGELKVKDETIRQTILDVCNYAILYLAIGDESI